MTNLDHIKNLINHGVKLQDHFGNLYDLTENFYFSAVKHCRKNNCNAVTYSIVIPGITEEMILAIWKDGHVDSGSKERVNQCLDR